MGRGRIVPRPKSPEKGGVPGRAGGEAVFGPAGATAQHKSYQWTGTYAQAACFHITAVICAAAQMTPLSTVGAAGLGPPAGPPPGGPGRATTVRQCAGPWHHSAAVWHLPTGLERLEPLFPAGVGPTICP